MKYSVAAVVAAAATGAMAHAHNATVVTEVVDVFVTYCPEPTEITHGDKTYTVTAPTTLTITDCPCTITRPVVPTTVAVCHDCPQQNSTIPVVPGAPHPTGSKPPTPEEPEHPGETPVPGAAAKVAGLSGLAGLAGIAAFFL